MIDIAALPLLGAILRTRGTDAERLALLLGQDVEQVRAGLAHLEAEGALSRTGGALVPVSPEDSLLAAAARALSATAAELQALPRLLRDWEQGKTEDSLTVHAELVHSTGPMAIIEAWRRYSMSVSTPSPVVGVHPDARGFGEVPWELIERLAAQAARTPIRILLGPDPLDAATHRALSHLADHGMRIRIHPAPPSVFIATADGAAAIPAHWGDTMPDTVLLLRNPSLAAGLYSYVEVLWAAGTPFESETPGWEPILGLMSQGLTDEEIAHRLNWSTRTVRRRIADAMDDLGVDNRFTLGEAWARRSGRPA